MEAMPELIAYAVRFGGHLRSLNGGSLKFQTATLSNSISCGTSVANNAQGLLDDGILLGERTLPSMNRFGRYWEICGMCHH